MKRLLLGLVMAWSSFVFPGAAVSDDPAANRIEESERLFVRRVAPLLRDKCVACHGNDPELIEGSLDLRSTDSLVAETDSGELPIRAGQPDASPFYLAVRRDHQDWAAMPPKESEALNSQQLAWIRAWIETGAAWPGEARQAEIRSRFENEWSDEDGVRVRTAGGLDEAWTERRYDPKGLWAYQPINAPHLQEGEPKNPIDVLIERAMPAGLGTAAPADRRTLIRRATFDLTGLPPTPAEVDAFMSDIRADEKAFEALINRLLESPHYGERMAQHWLDVVRYADSSGFANDYERGNAWRYRDYVVRSFNNDKPFDRFILEQIAGDEIDPADPEMLIATGFLRMGPWELTAMEVAKVARQRFLDDVTNSVGETFLGHSLQCCRCHDHKFDPIPTRDYYSVQAVFATTQLAEPHAPFLSTENTTGFVEEEYLQRQKLEHEQTLIELDHVLQNNAETWFAEQPQSDPWEAHHLAWKSAVEQAGKNNSRNVFNAARSILARGKTAQEHYPPKLVGFTPQQFGMERIARKGIERLRWELERYQPYALAVYNGRTPQHSSVTSPVRIPKDTGTAGELEKTCILTGGDPFSPAAPVRPAVLSVLTHLVAADIPDSIQGRRNGLAQWIADAGNPLTSRVIVNRVWQWHFGIAIAGNPNNFGSTGKRPTHPELLDWLADRFIKDGWSFKSLHRRIMLSDAYCRDSVSDHPAPEVLHREDPEGRLYAAFYPRRLSAEELRDATLVASGELNPEVGGIPCRPIINDEVALQPRQVMGTFAAAWVPNPLPAQRNRRSIYVLKRRGLMDPMLEVFNSPGPDFSCERRESSTVTPQVFTLFNSESSHARALALADAAIRQTESIEQAIAAIFNRVLARPPSQEELREVIFHCRRIRKEVASADVSRQPPPLSVTRLAVEENTGEQFSFEETLHAYADFVPDLTPENVEERTRVLADVCLVLLNSNEFVYVY